jgi:hypothetical protein
MFAQEIAVERIIRLFEKSLCATIATLRHVVADDRETQLEPGAPSRKPSSAALTQAIKCTVTGIPIMWQCGIRVLQLMTDA